MIDSKCFSEDTPEVLDENLISVLSIISNLLDELNLTKKDAL